MKFIFGARPAAPDSQVEADRTLVREPSPRQTMVQALPIAMVAYALVGWFWMWRLGLSRGELLFGLPPVGLGLLIAGMVIVHEMLHATLFPGFPQSPRIVVGIWWSRLSPYAHYGGPISRQRYLASAVAPLLVVSLLPMALSVGSGVHSHWGATVSLWNAMSSSVDILAVRVLLLQVPAGALLQNQGWKTFWQARPSALAQPDEK